MYRFASRLCRLLFGTSTLQPHICTRQHTRTRSKPDSIERPSVRQRKRSVGVQILQARWTRLLPLIPIVFICTLANAQVAFSNTSITMSWNEDSAQQAAQLATLNTNIRGALNASASDFCFEVKTAPADLLDFPSLNCTIGNAATPNGYTAANASFALVLGNMPFDYDSRAAHTLTLNARETSITPSGRTANSLTVTFTLSNIDETPVLTDETFEYVAPPAHSRERRYL